MFESGRPGWGVASTHRRTKDEKKRGRSSLRHNVLMSKKGSGSRESFQKDSRAPVLRSVPSGRSAHPIFRTATPLPESYTSYAPTSSTASAWPATAIVGVAPP
jgi:hypothetical protein